jgi:hypothetical protein
MYAYRRTRDKLVCQVYHAYILLKVNAFINIFWSKNWNYRKNLLTFTLYVHMCAYTMHIRTVKH